MNHDRPDSDAAGPNDGFVYRELVHAAAGRTLLEYLTIRYRHSDNGEWRSRIRDGRVRLDGETASPETSLRDGQVLIWQRPGWVEPRAPLDYEVRYRDGALLAVSKPPGLPTLPGAGFLENTLLRRVRLEDPRATPLHRLGRWTSGLVLFARTPGARSRLARSWPDVRKFYRALCRGRAARAEFRVETPIGPVPYRPLGRIHAASATGRPAASLVRVLRQDEHRFLAQIELKTGRSHQIRIHMAAAGHPLAGDPLYGPGGAPRPDSVALPGDPGYRLHAGRLTLEHPTSGARLDLRDPWPADLSGA